MAGTIVTDRIESDATYDSKIELASPVLVSNTFSVKSTGGTGNFNIVGANTNTDRTFTLPNNTGTLLTTASEGDIGTTNIANSAVTLAKLASSAQPIGTGQTWQDVSGSRTAGVTYTNSTGRPIMVSIRTQAVVADFTISVSGLVVAHASGSTATRSQLITVVPDGSTYVVSGFQSGSWVELR